MLISNCNVFRYNIRKNRKLYIQKLCRSYHVTKIRDADGDVPDC